MKELIKLIKQAGDLALAEQVNMKIDIKEDTSIVTNGDLAVSSFLENELKRIFSDYEIFSEENCKVIPRTNKVIVIDPIDGTQSYSRKEDSWSILIGFLVDEQPVKGIIYQPTTKALYYATKGQGAFCEENGKIYKMDSNSRFGSLKGFTTLKPKEGELEFAYNLGIEEMVRLYSAGLKIMEVAKANGDYYSNFRGKCSIWDLVAPLAILREAGGDLYFNQEMKFDFDKILMSEDFIVCNNRIKLSREWGKIK